MPLSKSKTSKRPSASGALKDIKNAIRGARNKIAAIQYARKSAPARELRNIADWSFGWLTALGITGNLKPRTILALATTAPLPSVAFERELKWVEAAVLRQKDDINVHVTGYDRIQSTLLADPTVQSAIDILDQLETNVGASLHYLALRFALLQVEHGLEAQKGLFNTYLHEMSSLTRLYAFWWSVRAEDDTASQHYIDTVNLRIQSWKIEPDLEAQFRYFLLNELPPSGEEHRLLSIATAASAIDTYEMFIALATVILGEKRPSAGQFLNTLETFLPFINDSRLHKLVYLGSASGTPNLFDGIPLEAQSLLYSDQNEERLRSIPVTLEEFRAYASITDDTPILQNKFCARLLDSLRVASRLEDDHTIAAAQLEKLGLMFGHSGIGVWISAVATELKPYIPPVSRVGLAQRFIHASDGLLAAIPIIEEDQQLRLVDYIRSNCPPPITDAASVLANGHSPRTTAHRNQHLDQLLMTWATFSHDNAAKLYLAEDELRRRDSRAARFLQLTSLISLDQPEVALEKAVAFLIKTPQRITWLPIHNILTAIYSEDTNKFPSKIETPMLFSICAAFGDQDFGSYVSYTCEDYIYSLGADRPSKVDLDQFKKLPDYYNYLLEKVCSLATMRLFAAFESERELEEERIWICQIMSKREPEKREAFETEARGIVTSRIVKEALKELQSSKISVDEDAIKIWAGRRLKDDYIRYQGLYARGLIVVDDSYRTSLETALATGHYPEALYDVPTNEASELLIQLVTRLITECTFNPEHGLDCYLSLRVRHGTMSGVLRGVVEREHIVTRRISEAGEYRTNAFWRETLGGEPDLPVWDALEARLAAFSKSFDALIDELTVQYIQIRRDDKPKGLFELGVNLITLYGLALEISLETTFEVFTQKTIQIFWALVELSLEKVRWFINHEMRMKFRMIFDELEAAIREELPLAPIIDSVIRARNGLDKTLDTVRDWFELPTDNDILTFSVEELIAISLETIKSYHRDFEPTLEDRVSATVPPLSGALTLCSDIFFLIFENIYTHCGVSDPHIEIRCWLSEGLVWFEIHNTVHEDRCGTAYVNHVEAALGRIVRGSYLSDVSREGGTGFPKLAKLVGYASGHGDLVFQLKADERKFWTKFSLRATLVKAPAEEPDAPTPS